MPVVDVERESRFLEEVKRLVLASVEGYACQVFLFGSRVQGRIKRSSDFDIGITGLAQPDFNAVKRKIEELVEESPVPHDIDVVNFDSAEEAFKNIALREISVWKNA